LFAASDDELPVTGICANTFNDRRVNHFFGLLLQKIKEKTGVEWHEVLPTRSGTPNGRQDAIVIPPRRVRYLSEISDTVRGYNSRVNEQSGIASQLYQLNGAIQLLKTFPENEKHR